jgi:hypothetical protein
MEDSSLYIHRVCAAAAGQVKQGGRPALRMNGFGAPCLFFAIQIIASTMVRGDVYVPGTCFHVPIAVEVPGSKVLVHR